MSLEMFFDKKITKISQLKEGMEYIFDKDIYHLCEIKDNRFTFVTMCGTYVANKSMIEQHLKEGIFTIKNY